MACFCPIKGYRKNPEKNEGKSGFTPNVKMGFKDQPLSVPCGQCIGCRLEHSRQWAVRVTHEASLHDQNIFVTFTYDDENLPPWGNLQRSDLQKFNKRHQKATNYSRFFYCGEYGENLERPHYHQIMFGYQPSDKEVYQYDHSDPQKTTYTSETLTKRWGLGHVIFGAVTFESAAYVSRYSTKKITGELAESHYRRVDPDSGEIFDLTPEFLGMSLKPGIGKPWLDLYGKDSYDKDEIIMRGKAMKPPRAYDLWLEENNPKLYKMIKKRRKDAADLKYNKPNESPKIVKNHNNFDVMKYDQTGPDRREYDLYKARNTIAKQKLQLRNLEK